MLLNLKPSKMGNQLQLSNGCNDLMDHCDFNVVFCGGTALDYKQHFKLDPDIDSTAIYFS